MASTRDEMMSPGSGVSTPAGSSYSTSTKLGGKKVAARPDPEAVRKSPFPFGQPTQFQGKIIYRPCRTGVFPPTDWNPMDAVRSSYEPQARLELEFVYGYAGVGETSNNLFVTSEGHAVYYVAGVGIVYNRAEHSQRFFTNHNDDISCMAICEAEVSVVVKEVDEDGEVEPERITYPPGTIVATGQTIPIVDGKSAKPFLCIWDTQTMEEIRRIYLDPDERDVYALSFSPSGHYLATISADDYHTVRIWDWKRGFEVCSGRGANAGSGVCWDVFSEKDHRFCTFGMRALKMWQHPELTEEEAEESEKEHRPPTWVGTPCAFGKCPMDTLVSACFLPPKNGEGILVTGTMAGDIYVWKGGKAILAIPAHEPGPPVVIKGVHQFGGVRGLTLRKDRRTLLSGGADGFVRVWNVEKGTLDESCLVKMYCMGFAKETPPAIRAISCDWNGDGFVVGTNKCDVWEFQREAKCLVNGHHGDLMSIAWHPVKPHIIATVTEEQRLTIFDVEKKDMLRTCLIGFGANAVHFSPVPLTSGNRGPGHQRFGMAEKLLNGGRANGASSSGTAHHIAIGGLQGRLKVVEEETLAPVFVAKDFATDIEDVRYSPNGKFLAACGRDQFIDIYSTAKYERLGRCFGHSSTVHTLDWSTDSRTLMTQDNSYEILYWTVQEGAAPKIDRSKQRDTKWAEWTSTLGFPVMGIWPEGTDGTDINSVHRSHKGGHIITADDFGDVKLFNYPCVVEGAAYRMYVGHSSHVAEIRFSLDDKYVMSAGGHDRGLFQWKTYGIADWTPDSDMNPGDGVVLPTSKLSRLEQEMKSKKGEELVWGPLDKLGKRWGYVRADGTPADMEDGNWGSVAPGGDVGPREMAPKLPSRPKAQQAAAKPAGGLLPSLGKAPPGPDRNRFRGGENDLRRVAEEVTRGVANVVRRMGQLPKLDGSPGSNGARSPGGYSANGSSNGTPAKPEWTGARKGPPAPGGVAARPNRANLRSARVGGGAAPPGGGAPGRDDKMRGSWDR